MSNIDAIIKTKLQYLKKHNIDTSLYEVKLLLADVLNKNIADLFFYNSDISSEEQKKFDKYIEMRKNFWPVDKILEKKSFYKLEFEINCDVLSPRYDTEILIEETLKLFNLSDKLKILEFGTGSGCIVISLLDELKNATALGIDISAKALEITKKNAKINGVLDRLDLLNIDWFDNNIEDKITQPFDLIISNPPYIPTKDISSLGNEVKNFDPLVALDGGEDGLRDYRKICELSKKLLKKDGFLIFEIGINQANDVIKIAETNNFKLINIHNDYNGIARCVILKK